MRHTPVLAHEVVEGLNLAPGKHLIDGTLGDAGHAEEILRRIAPSGKLLGIDADPESLVRAQHFLAGERERVIFVRGSFQHLETIVREHSFGPVHGILLDLGWSMPQFKERGRGFSFMTDEPLDMRYDPNSGQTAAELVNEMDAEELTRILRFYGEEKRAHALAEAIIAARPVARTVDIVRAVEKVYSARRGKIHPATQTFQALRIATNGELDVLATVLPQAVRVLAKGGRLAVITFHSLEDRIVKQFFRKEAELTIITKKPVRPSREEVKANPAARSAKLRIAEKI